jgi:hypothetical protein
MFDLFTHEDLPPLPEALLKAHRLAHYLVRCCDILDAVIWRQPDKAGAIVQVYTGFLAKIHEGWTNDSPEPDAKRIMRAAELLFTKARGLQPFACFGNYHCNAHLAAMRLASLMEHAIELAINPVPRMLRVLPPKEADVLAYFVTANVLADGSQPAPGWDSFRKRYFVMRPTFDESEILIALRQEVIAAAALCEVEGQITLNPSELRILQALANKPLKGAVVAARAGLNYDYTRHLLPRLKARGYVSGERAGYALTVSGRRALGV